LARGIDEHVARELLTIHYQATWSLEEAGEEAELTFTLEEAFPIFAIDSSGKANAGWQYDDELAGRDPGRPPDGITDPVLAEALLLKLLAGDHIDDLRGLMGRGRLSEAKRARKGELNFWIKTIRAAKVFASVALAEALQCSPSAIYNACAK
jgi:hypothetical protein